MSRRNTFAARPSLQSTYQGVFSTYYFSKPTYLVDTTTDARFFQDAAWTLAFSLPVLRQNQAWSCFSHKAGCHPARVLRQSTEDSIFVWYLLS